MAKCSRRADRDLAILVAVVLGGLAGPFGAGCDSRGRTEAGQIMRALEVVRNAPRDQKRGPVEALAATACSLETVCATRDRCASAYRHLAEGVEVEARVRAAIEKLEQAPPPTTAPIPGLASELDRAEAELTEAKAALPACEEAASILRRTFGI